MFIFPSITNFRFLGSIAGSTDNRENLFDLIRIAEMNDIFESSLFEGWWKLMQIVVSEIGHE